jgi:hypothetical protein
MLPARPKSSKLWQEIALTLLVKITLLTLIWAVWFSAPQDQSIGDQQAAAQILSTQPQQESNHDAIPRAR